jgi:universal stress protein A
MLLVLLVQTLNWRKLMKYKHILVALDLAEDSAPSDFIVSKAVSLAKNLDAKLSFIHVDTSHLDIDLLDYDNAETRILNEKYETLMAKLDVICDPIEYPVSNKIVIGGEVEVKLIDEVKKLNVDLLVAGHHYGFWNHWWSSAHKLVDLSVADLLLVRI